ncbi:hypothetical protein NC653_027202 [Populus alba x Populus x berolinensis]|uniref:Uncharacterized protein n=1 Tax=Populus alba x Populus x berolinensis TaxID=444605 RepID=A0AAD6Q4T7_9ROSI|nr:hypothetical protein NC653_027202 [Populus alba x Populus x berolinensis]
MEEESSRKMSNSSRNCMEASLAGIEGRPSHGSKSNSPFRSWSSRKNSYFSGGNGGRDAESKRKQAEDSFQRVIDLCLESLKKGNMKASPSLACKSSVNFNVLNR